MNDVLTPPQWWPFVENATPELGGPPPPPPSVPDGDRWWRGDRWAELLIGLALTCWVLDTLIAYIDWRTRRHGL